MRSDIQEWREYARAYAILVAMENTEHHVSVNDLYLAICQGKIPAPPGEQVYKRGHALCSVFSHPMFHNTGNTVLSVNPISKKRKVIVWAYDPAIDDRAAPLSRKSFSWSKGGKGW